MKIKIFYILIFIWIISILLNILSYKYSTLLLFSSWVVTLQIILPIIWIISGREINNSEKEMFETKKNILLRGIPYWLKVLIISSFFFTFINFGVFLIIQDGTPIIENGEYILQNHGNFIKTLTKTEYFEYKFNEIRGFLGHWNFFYGLVTPFIYRNSK